MDYGMFHAWSGGGKLNMAFSLLEGRTRTISSRMRDAILQCTLCGACDVSCKYSTDIEVSDAIFDLRRYLVQEQGPHPAHQALADKVRKDGNPYGELSERRQDWYGQGVKSHGPPSKTLFFTGCTAAYRQSSIARAATEILTRAGITFQVDPAERCCGSPLYRSGMVDEARVLFEQNINAWSQQNVQEIITACPGCYSMFVAEYPKFLSQEYREKWRKIRFRHTVQVVEELIRQKKIEFKNLSEMPEQQKVAVTYHDPCHLGRGAEPWTPEWDGSKRKVFNQMTIYDPPKQYRRGNKGVYAPPRFILQRLKATVDFVEMQRREEYAYCCGSGGGVKVAFPEMADQTALERLTEAESVLNCTFPDNPNKVLVSACPFCKTNFEAAIQASHLPLRYRDLNQLVLERVKFAGEGK